MQRLQLLQSHLCANLFAHLEEAPADPILGVTLAYNRDTSPHKIDLGVGAYRTDQGQPYVFTVVREAERRILGNHTKEYLPIDGLERFNSLVRDLLFGADSPAVAEGRVASIQTISGTGSLRVGAEFLSTHLSIPAVYVPRPTWDNHFGLFGRAGLLVREYPYWNADTRDLDFVGLIRTLQNAATGSVIVLHGCAHNPTGIDPTPQQWRAIADVMENRSLIPYFDVAYQGFATGDIAADAFSLRYFVSRGFNLIASQSFEKNFGLYGEPIGALHIVCQDAPTATKVVSQVKLTIRPMYSSPSLHAALIVSTVLGDLQLKQQWERELQILAGRIQAVRTKLIAELQKLPSYCSVLSKQVGMFSYTGLTPTQCQKLISKWHCYLLLNGRVSLAGLNSSNLKYFAQALLDVAG